MADLSDVLDAISAAAEGILYPQGTAAASLAGAPVRIGTGWPDANLDADLAKGIVNLTVWNRGTARNLRPIRDGWRPDPPAAPSLTVTVSGETATFGGTAATPDMIAAVVVDGRSGFSHPVTPDDTPESVAQALADQIIAVRPALADGGVLTVPDVMVLRARVVAGGTERRELRRVAQGVQLVVWAPSPALRDAVGKALSEALTASPAVALPDGSTALLSVDGDMQSDDTRQQPLYRRDLLLTAEYAVFQTRRLPAVALPTLTNQEPTVTEPVIRSTVVA